jgi:hypothetical protein
VKLKIDAASLDVTQYKTILDQFNFEEIASDYDEERIIEINTLEDIFRLMKDLDKDLVINKRDNRITIYDDYLE